MNASWAWHRSLYLTGALLAAGVVGFMLAQWTGTFARDAKPAVHPALREPAARMTLEIEPSYLTMVGIEVEAVEPGRLGEEVRASGSVSVIPDAEGIVAAHVAGSVVRICKRLGDAVKAGELLALLQSPEAAGIAADLDIAESKLRLAESIWQRERGLFAQKVTPRQDLEAAQAQLSAAQAEARRARVAAANAHISDAGGTVRVASPLSGRITSTTIALGGSVQPDTELFRVADVGRVQVHASVTAADALRITPGDPAVISSAAGAAFAAHVTSMTSTVNEQTRSVRVVLSVAEQLHNTVSHGTVPTPRPDSEGALASVSIASAKAHSSAARALPVPGEMVQVMITPGAVSATAFILPDDAVQRIAGRDVVFVRTDKGFRVQRVAVSLRGAGRVAIQSGIEQGDEVATRNAFLLKAELGKDAEESDE